MKYIKVKAYHAGHPEDAVEDTYEPGDSMFTILKKPGVRSFRPNGTDIIIEKIEEGTR